MKFENSNRVAVERVIVVLFTKLVVSHQQARCYCGVRILKPFSGGMNAFSLLWISAMVRIFKVHVVYTRSLKIDSLNKAICST
jgi:hypothetical protein